MPDPVTALSTRVARRFREVFLVPTPAPDKFSDIDISKVEQLLNVPPDATENRPFIEGDHFQEGDAWVGPSPARGDAQYRDFLDILKPAFVSKNVIKEGCERLAGAVIGWEPRWTWVPRRHDLDENPPTDQELASIQELTSALTDWWDKREIHTLLKRLVFRMLWAKRGGWRLYVPSGLTDENGRVRASTIEEALDMIYMDVPEPEDIGIYEHPDTKQKLGIMLYTDAMGKKRAELCYLDGEQTVIRLLPTEGTTAVAKNDFGKHLTIYVAELDSPLITEQIRSLQKMLNMTLTLLGKGLVDNHFLERIFMNAMPPGHWTYEEDGKTRKAYVIEPRSAGGRTDSYIQGIDFQQPSKNGDTYLANPSVTIRQPLDPNGTIRGSEYWYQVMLEALRQDHILINQLATPSGKSRDHSRGDFIDSSKDPIMQTDRAGRELLLTVVYMVEEFTGQKGKWTKDFKPIFKCRPNYGPLSVAERQQNVTEAEKGFLSDETVMSLNGTDDVDAELALIKGQKRAQLALSKLRADAVTQWSVDFPREVALFLAGFTDAEIKDVMKRVTRSNSEDPNDPAPALDAGGAGGAARPAIPGPTAPSRPTATRSLPPAGNRPTIAANEGANG